MRRLKTPALRMLVLWLPLSNASKLRFDQVVDAVQVDVPRIRFFVFAPALLDLISEVVEPLYDSSEDGISQVGYSLSASDKGSKEL